MSEMIRKEEIQPMCASAMPSAMKAAAHLMKPDLARTVASAISPPIQNIASQAPFSVRMSFQVRTPAMSMMETASIAIDVAPRPVRLPVAQSTRHIRKTKESTSSSRDIGPIFSSSSRAI